MIQGAVFDADGTLLDSMPIWEDLGELYLKTFGIKAEPDLGRKLFSMNMYQGAAYLAGHYGLDKTPRQVAEELDKQMETFYRESVSLKAGARRFLENMYGRGIALAVATASGRTNIEAAFRRLGILSFFQEILTCTELEVDKNSPEIYLEAARRLHSSPDATLVFEDAFHAIETAKRAGFKTVAVYDSSGREDWENTRRRADYFLEEGFIYTDKLEEIL